MEKPSDKLLFPPEGYDFDRTNDTIHDAVFNVVAAVAQFSKLFVPHMERNLFVSLVKVMFFFLKRHVLARFLKPNQVIKFFL